MHNLTITNNRALTSLAHLSRKGIGQSNSERKARTRTLIQLGGLLDLSGLLDTCDITLGEDLQLDIESMDKAAILLGILLEFAHALPSSSSTEQLESWRLSGERFMKQTKAKEKYGT